MSINGYIRKHPHYETDYCYECGKEYNLDELIAQGNTNRLYCLGCWGGV